MSYSREVYSDIPWLKSTDVQLWGAPSWELLDEIASSWVGQPCLVLPSVRVGLCWALEAKGYVRHQDHVLVPRFIGRCILNSIGRFALPVETPTTKTRIALVVDQFGRRQDLKALKVRFQESNWSYIEDSPYGIGIDENAGEASMGRFIGLSKVLPIVQGALFVAGDESIRLSIIANRRNSSAWSLPVWLAMLYMRKRYVSGYSDLADAAYEMYLAAKGGCGALRGNINSVFGKIDEIEFENKRRLTAVVESLGESVLVPDQARIGYVVPFLPGDAINLATKIFREFGFSDSVVHVDLDRNMMSPNYARCLLIPLHSKIPRANFEGLLKALKKLLILIDERAEYERIIILNDFHGRRGESR